MSARPLARLLLVEDETVLRGLVSQFLTVENYEVVAVGDGQAAVAAYADGGPFDVVLLDLNLPILPGVEACRRIKLMNAEQPFLVCSAAVLDSHHLALAAMGVTEVLGKPYHPRELLERLDAILRPLGAEVSGRAPHVGLNRGTRAASGGSSPARALSERRAFE